MPKTEFLQIRLSFADRQRVQKAANSDYLDMSTWARQVILRALDEHERAVNKDGAQASLNGEKEA